MELLKENNQASEKEREAKACPKRKPRSERHADGTHKQSRAVDLTERMMGGRRKGTHTPPVPTSKKEG